MADRALAAVVVVLCVVALALAASTLAATGGIERGPGEGSGPGSSDQPQSPPVDSNQTGGEPLGLNGDWVELLIAAFVVLAIPGVLVLGRSRLLGALLGIGFFVVLFAVIYFVSGMDALQPVQSPVENVSEGLQGGGELGSADESSQEQNREMPSVFTFGIIGLALAMAVGLVYYASAGVDASVDPEPAAESDPDDSPAVAEAAGRAADRIDDHEGDASNAVYAAWEEMTTALQVPDPATSTPGEFADTAVAAGMDEARVDDLTDLFERVRYGHEPVTEAHERQAAETLRAIEADYDGVDATAASDPVQAAATGSAAAESPDASDAGSDSPDGSVQTADENDDGGDDA
ncbi:DUF4129 domain-containing protein [Halosimplex amylolyticum]|uniref:DUF4129 domain-containing protein n=1 Tax=Halosimplex amylolyticum TaxID=3396616 RepID=UPI003F564081